MVFTFSACSNDGDESEDTASTLQPFAGNWQCLDEEGEYHSILIIYEDGQYQFLYQNGDDKGADTGMMAFDRNLNTMTFFPTSTLGSDTKDSEYQWIVRGKSNSRLQIVDEDGNCYTYEKITDGTFPKHDDWGKSLVGGTWKIYVRNTSGEILDTRRYTFFEGGTYSFSSYTTVEDGTFKLDKNTIILDGEQGDIVTLTSNSLKFTFNGEIYSGARVVQKDKQLVESNKKLLIGTWSCVIPTYWGNEKTLLTLKANGEYENEYLDDYGSLYEGNYYVSEDKIFFEDAKGKDPIGGEHQIKELTSKGFVLLTDFYVDGDEISGTKK